MLFLFSFFLFLNGTGTRVNIYPELAIIGLFATGSHVDIPGTSKPYVS